MLIVTTVTCIIAIIILLYYEMKDNIEQLARPEYNFLNRLSPFTLNAVILPFIMKQCAQKYVSFTCLKPEVENGMLFMDKEKYVASESVTVRVVILGLAWSGPQSITCSQRIIPHPISPCHWVNCTHVCSCAFKP